MTITFKNGKRFRKDEHGDWIEHPETLEERSRADSRIQSMSAAGRAPSTSGGEKDFLRGKLGHHNLGHLPADSRDACVQNAIDHGVNPHGKVYLSGLAQEPMDPKAWVSSKSEADAIVKHNGWTKIKD